MSFGRRHLSGVMIVFCSVRCLFATEDCCRTVTVFAESYSLQPKFVCPSSRTNYCTGIVATASSRVMPADRWWSRSASRLRAGWSRGASRLRAGGPAVRPACGRGGPAVRLACGQVVPRCVSPAGGGPAVRLACR